MNQTPTPTINTIKHHQTPGNNTTAHTMSDEGASRKEQLLEGSRRNNTELLHEVLASFGEDRAQIAQLINESRDALGNTALHLAAQNGHYEALDTLLDQPGVDVDPVNCLDGDTPLHLAVRYAKDEPEHGAFIVEELIEAGADARVKNKGGLKPVQLIHGENDKAVEALQGAEYAIALEEEEAKRNALQDGDEGSASASESESDE